MTRQTRFIPGIYNYCDRWCQKCPFTARCLAYERQRRARASGELDTRDGESVLNYVQKQVRAAVQMLRRAARDLGTESAIAGTPPLGAGPPSLPSGGAPRTDADRTTPQGRYDPLVLSAHVYGAIVDSWLVDESDWLRDRGVAVRRLETSTGLSPAVLATGGLTAILDTILWDRTLIPAKLARAVSSEPGDESGALDAAGSAKVALLSMDRSAAAWQALRQQRQVRSESIIPILAHMDALRRDTEVRFPGARRFHRPGFDGEQTRREEDGRWHERHASRTG